MRLRKWMWLAIPVAGGVAMYVNLSRPQFRIGPTPISAEFIPKGARPWIDTTLPLIGKIRYPNPDEELLHYLTEDPSIAGILKLGPSTTNNKWRIGGVEVEAEILTQLDYAGGEYGNVIVVPNAPSSTQNHVELWVVDRWVPVTLPVDSGFHPKPAPVVSVTAGPHTLTANPGVRIFDSSTTHYHLRCEPDDGSVLLNGELSFEGEDSGVLTHQPWTSHPSDLPLSVDRLTMARFRGDLLETEKTPLHLRMGLKPPLHVGMGLRSTYATLTTDAGQVVAHDSQAFAEAAGYDWIEVPDPRGGYKNPIWIGTGGVRRYVPVFAMRGAVVPAIGYRIRRKVPITFHVENYR
jgi:hypothetical protein